ncbi:MAG: T9SS type A sorting domain-containing protein [Bacteroidota bacterium]
MRIILFLLLLVVSDLLLQGQIKLMPLKTKNQDSNATEQENDTKPHKTLKAFFWEDFSTTPPGAPLDTKIIGTDTFGLWDVEASRGVLINQTMGLNAPSQNVATFDGLDRNGDFLGDSEDNTRGEADRLVSDTINLVGPDSLYFSFFWQAGGNVEPPDQRDSLRLEFRDSTRVSNWRTVWIQGGDGTSQSSFTQENIEIEPQFISEHFQFRFTSIGDLNGSFDAWHVDWIYLDSSRTAEFPTYFDRALTGQLNDPFAPFTAVPTSHIQDLNELAKGPIFQVSNLDESGIVQPLQYNYSITAEPSTVLFNLSNIQIDQPRSFGQTIIPVQIPNPVFPIQVLSDSLSLFSEVVLFTKDTIPLGGVQSLLVNDTLRSTTVLKDYYAYDDGTAEFAAGINIVNGQIAVQFWVNEPDTLTHVDIYFPKIQNDTLATTLSLKVLSSLDEEQAPLRIQNIPFAFSDSLNRFTRYELMQGDTTKGVIVQDTFYIGYQQFVNQEIGIGFDRSNPEASQYLFENANDGWKRNESITGALMIRPVFGKATSFPLSVSAKAPEIPKIFPNPVFETFRIEGDYKEIQITDIAGRVIATEPKKAVHQLSSHLKDGLYLVKILLENDDVQVARIVKKAK